MRKSDEELMELCRRGKKKALEELLRRYQNKLMAFIYSMVRNYHLAEDIFQDTFIRVYRQAGRFNSEYKFKTWLYTIASNRCRDELRKMSRRPSVPVDGSGDFTGGQFEEKSPVSLADKKAGPREMAKAREFMEILEEELGGFSAEHREVVVMSRLLGLKYEEIAEVLDIPSGTVRSRLHYALARLRERLKDKIDL